MAADKKIIIYGGAFDPPHEGHFALIRAAAEQLKPEVLYVVPCFRSPFKDSPAAPYRDRAAMLKDGLKACGLVKKRGGARVAVHPFEFRRGQVTYTWQTVRFFKKLHPGAQLYFLLGSDCLGAFRKWKHYRRILADAVLLAGRRPGFALKRTAGTPFAPLNGRFPLIASNALKAELFPGLRPAGLLPSTWSYINRKGLYLGALRRRLEKILPPRRFAHSLAVAALAAELALKHGADPLRAALAGLLHDAARDMPPRSLVRFALRRRLRAPRLRETILKAPVLLHAAAGAALAAEKFGVRDRAVLDAIRQHTLGARNPGLLSKIIYVADLGACGRDFPEAAEVAALARRDLDAAYRRANYVKLIYASGADGWRHPETAKVWHSLQAREKNK
ncbi:MAG: hypothetical protein A3J79_03810 [Elusimicrobia bacterium RIFOXYB2_FULL_62_6]|nr:MAG: hypothetical protein A3J79_03810 [Elusimicrobia bacterium RIFOXYB2_FULL_62_6]